VAHSGHHKHSYYVIRNSEHLKGYTDREIEMVAQIARYHRKSPPSEDKHAEFAALAESDRATVRGCAALLRIAVAVVLTVVPRAELGADHDLSFECWSANERTGLLSVLLGAPVEVRPA